MTKLADPRNDVAFKKIFSEDNIEGIKDILPYMMYSFIRNSLSVSKANLEKIPLIDYKECSTVVKNDYISYVDELIK